MSLRWKDWKSGDKPDRSKVTVHWKNRLLVGEIVRNGGLYTCYVYNHMSVLGVWVLERVFDFQASTMEEGKEKVGAILLNIMH